MTRALYPLLLLAATGFILSVGVHCMALAGIPIPGGKLVWNLHIGIFIVWVPTVLVASQAGRYANRKDFWRIALGGCPPWMRIGVLVLFAYAILNFTLHVFSHQPKQPIDDAPLSVVRAFSGHWMFFYGAALAMLHSRIRAPYLFQPRKCPNGHAVSPVARFCPECGYAFPDAARNA